MATPLDKPVKRALDIDGQPYVITISPDGVKITQKGRRLGREMSWRDLLSGDAQLATQLLGSLSNQDVKHVPPRAADHSKTPNKKAAATKDRAQKAR